MPRAFRLSAAATAVVLLTPTAATPDVGTRDTPAVAGEAYYFLIPESTAREQDPVYAYDAEEDRILKAAPGLGGLGRLAREGQQALRSQEWVVLPEAVYAYMAASLSAPRADLRLSFPEKITAASRVILTDTDGTKFVRFEYKGDHYFLPAALVVSNTVLRDADRKSLPIGFEFVDHETPLPLDYEPADLVRIDQRWNFHRADYPKYLRAEAAALLDRLLREAERRGIHIRVFSAYRSSSKQRFLYLSQISRSGLRQRAVAKPGHSEHQLGTAVDLCGLDPKTVASPAFGRTREGRWLEGNAARYGFRASYTQRNSRQTRYAPEPWHYRYMGSSGFGDPP